MPEILYIIIPAAVTFLLGIGGGIYIERHKPGWAAFLRGKYHDIR